MLTPVTLPLGLWIAAGIAWMVEFALMWRAQWRYRRTMRDYRAASKRLDTAAAAVDDSPPGTVTPLRSPRDHRVRPLHELGYADQSGGVRRDSRDETY
ncbi:hypothetical protein [Nocardia sp. A7]|uniref:hypothetical protein n=1 Tax=Nocardia sp. A7 TaxID=2789274 RepID=UPI00397B2C96